MRHAFDRFEIPFDLIFKERVRAGGLGADYDVILVPNQGRTAKGLVFDVAPRGGPRAYTKTGRYRFLGGLRLVGGHHRGHGGSKGFWSFAGSSRGGGLLVTLGEASHVPAGVRPHPGDRRPASGFGLLRAGSARRSGDLRSGPSDLLRIRRGPDTGPLRERTAPRSPAAASRRPVLMTFSGRVLAGHLRGADQIDGRPAVVDVPLGDGRIVLFATNPCYRWQNHGEFGMLFNTLLHHNDPAR